MTARDEPEVRVHVEMSEEVLRLLDANDIDLLQELRRADLAVARGTPIAIGGETASRGKAVELIILASAAAAPLIAGAITRIIDAVGRNRRALVSEVRQGDAAADKPNGETATYSTTVVLWGLKVELKDSHGTR